MCHEFFCCKATFHPTDVRDSEKKKKYKQTKRMGGGGRRGFSPHFGDCLTSDVCDDELRIWPTASRGVVRGQRGLGLWAGLLLFLFRSAKERFLTSKGNNGGDRARVL